MVINIIIITALALLINDPKLPYPKSFAAQDNGTINVGAKVEDPDDGQEDNQDHDGSEDKDSPQGLIR